MIRCPRCGAELVEHEPDKRWARWFECVECCTAWHFACAVLEMGRTAKYQAAPATDIGT